MSCPKCGRRTSLRERICPGCGWFAEQGRTVLVKPPRAPWWRRWLRPRRMSRLRQMFMRPEQLVERGKWQWLWGLVPGLGHVRSGMVWQGTLIFALIATLLGLALGPWSDWRQMLIGVAAGVHATSMLFMMPREIRLDAQKRFGALLGLLAFCMLFYFPLTEILNRLIEGDPLRRAYAHYGANAQRVAFEQMWWEAVGIGFIVIFIGIAALAVYIVVLAIGQGFGSLFSFLDRLDGKAPAPPVQGR